MKKATNSNDEKKNNQSNSDSKKSKATPSGDQDKKKSTKSKNTAKETSSSSKSQGKQEKTSSQTPKSNKGGNNNHDNDDKNDKKKSDDKEISVKKEKIVDESKATIDAAKKDCTNLKRRVNRLFKKCVDEIKKMTDEHLPRKARKGGKSKVSIIVPEGKKSGDKISFK